MKTTLVHLSLIAGWLATVATAAAQTRPASGPGFTGALELIIKEAVFEHNRKNEQPDRSVRPNLMFTLEAEDGKWSRGLGYGLNIGDHFAFVQEASVTADRVFVKMAAIVAPDDWIGGGDGSYTLDMKRDAQGKLSGTWEGLFRGEPLKGNVTGRVRAPRPIRVPNFVPLAPDEHPRLMFRKHELPALKEKLKTPLGQAFLEKAKAATGDPVSNGMLWQLTGEKSYAEAAMKIVGGYNDLAPEGTGTGSVGHRFVAVAHTLDLCWDAWPEGFRKDLSDRMINDLSVIQRRLQIAGANFHPCSNFYGPARGCAAIATLVFYGDKGKEPRKPIAPEEIAAKGDLTAKLMLKTGKLDAYRAEYAKLLAKWQVEYEEWKAMGGADLEKTELFLKGFHHMNRHYRVGIGDGGFAAETGVYSAIAPHYPLMYAAYYLRCFGRNPSAYPDVTHHMSRRLMQCLFPPPKPDAKGGRRDNEPISLKINSISGFTYSGVHWLAGAFPLTPDEHKPALLWAWNYIRGVREDDPASVANIIQDVGEYGVSLAHAFVNYPLDMKPRHPKDVMPLHWQAPTMGLYLYRNGWTSTDDFVAQVFGKCIRIGGWNHPNAGTFNLWGLGHAWATCNPDRLGYVEQENIIIVPEDKINAGAPGYVTHLETLSDGSGTLSIDLRDLYGTAKSVPRLLKRDPAVLHGGVTVKDDKDDTDRLLPVRDAFNNRVPENWADTGLTGMRAFAFDYSGKSGAPCLMVIVDKITGAKTRLWNWHVARDAKHQDGTEAFKNVRVEPDGFVLEHADAFLKATFVGPKPQSIERLKQDVKLGGGMKGERGFAGFLDRIQARSNDSFFVVVTVQRKDAPAIKVEGTGLDAKVTVGQRTIRFDGEKIILGQTN